MAGKRMALPFFELDADGLEHPLANGLDQSRFLGERDKVQRQNQSARRMLPAYQHLGAGSHPQWVTCFW